MLVKLSRRGILRGREGGFLSEILSENANVNETFEMNLSEYNILCMRIAFQEAPKLKNNELAKQRESIMVSKKTKEKIKPVTKVFKFGSYELT